MRKRSEWSGGPSDIEGKTTRVGASKCGQRMSFNRTRVAGHLDEIQGAVANTLRSYRNGAVGFIDWLGLVGKNGIIATELKAFWEESRVRPTVLLLNFRSMLFRNA